MATNGWLVARRAGAGGRGAGQYWMARSSGNGTALAGIHALAGHGDRFCPRAAAVFANPVRKGRYGRIHVLDSQDFVRAILVPRSGAVGDVAVDGSKISHWTGEEQRPLVHHGVGIVPGRGWIGLSMVREACDGSARSI